MNPSPVMVRFIAHSPFLQDRPSHLSGHTSFSQLLQTGACLDFPLEAALTTMQRDAPTPFRKEAYAERKWKKNAFFPPLGWRLGSALLFGFSFGGMSHPPTPSLPIYNVKVTGNVPKCGRYGHSFDGFRYTVWLEE